MIDADYHQKVVMKFSLKSESSGDLFTPHQAFVRLTNEKTKQEIFFVTEPEPSKVFKFDLVSFCLHCLFNDNPGKKCDIAEYKISFHFKT